MSLTFKTIPSNAGSGAGVFLEHALNFVLAATQTGKRQTKIIDLPRCRSDSVRASEHSVAVSRPYSCIAAKSACAKHREQRDEATAVVSWLANRTLVPRAGLTAAQRLDALRSRVRERDAAQ